MDIAALLKDLGIIWPQLWTQMAIFIVAYLALSVFIFRPYMKAFVERQKSTAGNAELAERLVQEAQELQTEYEKRAKELNSQFKSIYDESRTRALHERDQIVAAARAEVEGLVAKSKREIETAFSAAQHKLQSEVPGVAQAITTQLLGRELR